MPAFRPHVGPKNITRSVLDPKPRKKKRKPVDEFEVTASKKKRVAPDDEPVKLKKKKRPETELPPRTTAVVKSRAMVVAQPQEGMRLSSRQTNNLMAHFGSNADTIIEMLEANNNDGALTLLKKKLLMTVIDVLPDAEAIIRETKGGKGTYQFVTLISQIRELITDIQSDQDRKHIARNLCEDVIRPSFMDIAQNMITQHHSFKKEMEGKIKPDQLQNFGKELQELARNMAKDMTAKYLEVEQKIFNALK